MVNFCPKCGKELKPRAKFCSSCGFRPKIKETASPAPPPASAPTPAPAPASSPPPPPPPPPVKSSGCGTGCLVGCLIFLLINLLIIGLLIGGGWWLLRKMKMGKDPGSYFEISSASKSQKMIDCGSSASCLEEELKKCSPAEGKSDIGIAEAEYQVLGISDDDANSCVIYFKITEMKEMPEGLKGAPGFIIEKLLEDLSMECLVPESIYKQGIEKTGEYVGENMSKVCEGPLFDMAEKFGVDLEN